jgi:hypothetical protein
MPTGLAVQLAGSCFLSRSLKSVTIIEMLLPTNREIAIGKYDAFVVEQELKTGDTSEAVVFADDFAQRWSRATNGGRGTFAGMFWV